MEFEVKTLVRKYKKETKNKTVKAQKEIIIQKLLDEF
jgi:hypothetical protein